MDLKAETREFLASRRARLTPDKAGLPAYGGNHRRVPGLRREEVAMLAGVSVDYYTRLERGNLAGASEEVLEALAGALQLDEAERGHLFDLARAANASGAARSRARRRPPAVLRPTVQRILDALDAPAFVRNGRLDVLGANPLGRALYAPLYDSPTRSPERPVNTARFQFLDPAGAARFWGDAADRMAHDAVAILRAEAGRNPYDRGLTDLVGELSTRSEDFRRLWASHDVRLHRTGTKVFHHPAVGSLELGYEALELPADPGLQMNVYTAVPGSPSADGLTLLASLAATTSAEGARVD
ncbi:transcriptional regulator [Sediminihabitans luteus]|nr:helix-turn-helix transcriptional regulator [Sediminihabitans luteus]GII97885.1 transcriptional regulator [Sediminihabitans luteus]